MKSSNLLFLAIILIGLCSASCGSKDSSGGCDEVETDQKETVMIAAQSALIDAQIAYSTDSSPAKCNAVANTWDDYITKMRSFINCLEGPARDAWETAYSLQVQERNAFSC